MQHCSRQNAIPTAQCCSAMKAHSWQCFTADTPMDICSSYRCAVTQHQCSAALFRATCNPHCSVLLCNEGSQQAVCHCSYTCGDLLFIQVCSDPAQMQCSSVQGKMQSPLFQCCSAMKAHSRHFVTAVTPMEICSSHRCAVTQHKCSAALFRAKCSPHMVQCCSAKQAHSRQCFTSVTPVDICSSYRCAVTQHQCTVALFRAKCTPHMVQCCSAKQAHSRQRFTAGQL